MTDASAFQNPTGFWTYTGPFIVELVPGTPTHNVPSPTLVKENLVIVPSGRVSQSMGGLSLRHDGHDFNWGYNFIVKVSTDTGQPLWVNRDYLKRGSSATT